MKVSNNLLGKKGKSVKVFIDENHVMNFAQALEDHNSLYHSMDPNSAYERRIVPLTYSVALPGDTELLTDLDVTKILHGEQEFIYYDYLQIGEIYTSTLIISNIEEKETKYGINQFITLSTEFRNLEDDLVLVSNMKIIYRTGG